MIIFRNKIARVFAFLTLFAAFAGMAHAADRYVYYSLADGSATAFGVCDDSTSDGFHTQLHAVAVYVETWDDGISNGLDELEMAVDDINYGVGTYHVATLNGSGEKVYLVITN